MTLWLSVLLLLLYCYLTFGHRRYSSSNRAIANSVELYPQNPLFDQSGMTIQLIPDLGIPSKFAFGPTNTYAYQNLAANIPNNGKTYILRWWDCYCAGDVVVAMEDGKNIITAQRLPAGPVYSNCNNYISDMMACGVSLAHQQADANLSPGYHNVSMLVSRGWYERGIMFVGVYSVCGANNKLCCNDVSNCTGVTT